MKTRITKTGTGKVLLTAMFMMSGIIFLPTSALAQERMDTDNFENRTRLGIGLDLGLPAQDEYDFGIGGVLSLERDFSEVVAGTLSAGYTNISLDDNAATFDNVGFIPVKAGIKIFPGRPFYFSGEAGVAFNTNSEELATAFTYSGGVGFLFRNGLDLSLRFEDYVRDSYDPSFFALRIAYGLKLN